MNDKEKWRESDRDIHASGTTWYIYIYITNNISQLSFNIYIIYINHWKVFVYPLQTAKRFYQICYCIDIECRIKPFLNAFFMSNMFNIIQM